MRASDSWSLSNAARDISPGRLRVVNKPAAAPPSPLGERARYSICMRGNNQSWRAAPARAVKPWGQAHRGASPVILRDSTHFEPQAEVKSNRFRL